MSTHHKQELMIFGKVSEKIRPPLTEGWKEKKNSIVIVGIFNKP